MQLNRRNIRFIAIPLDILYRRNSLKQVMSRAFRILTMVRFTPLLCHGLGATNTNHRSVLALYGLTNFALPLPFGIESHDLDRHEFLTIRHQLHWRLIKCLPQRMSSKDRSHFVASYESLVFARFKAIDAFRETSIGDPLTSEN